MSRKHTTLLVDENLVELAKLHRINMSQLFELTLREKLGVTDDTMLRQFRLEKELEIRNNELEIHNKELEIHNKEMKIIKDELKQIQEGKTKVEETRASKVGTDEDIIEEEIKWAAGMYEEFLGFGKTSKDPEQYISGRVSTMNNLDWLSFVMTEAEYRKRVLDVARVRAEGQ